MALTENHPSDAPMATNGAEPPIAAGAPPVMRRGPRWMVATVALAGLVVVFAGGYALGHDTPKHVPAAAPRSPASAPVTSRPSTSLPSTGAPSGTAVTPTTEGTTFPTDESGMVRFFSNTAVEPTIDGCTENLHFSWTFDPARTPPDGTEVVILFDDPVGPHTGQYIAFLGTVTVDIAVNLQAGQGTWSAVVTTVGTQAAVPQPISIDVTATC